MPRIRRNEFPDLSGQADEVKSLMRRLPTIVGKMAVRFSKDSFRRQGWIDQRVKKWPERKRPLRRRRALLIKTGRLRRSIRIVRKTADSVTIGTDVPYARIHNEGGTISATQSVGTHSRKAHKRRKPGRKRRTVNVSKHTVGAHTRRINTTIPKRQFLGESQLLKKRIRKHIDDALSTIVD